MGKIKLKVKAVIFDMDGVITNTMPDHFHAWRSIFRKHGIPVNYYDVYSREGQKGITSVKEIFAHHNKPIDEKTMRRILKDKEILFKKTVKTRFIPGARRFLRYLHNENFLLALVTGTSRHELHQILPRRIYNLFSVSVTGSDVKSGKPHPEPYLKALQRLKIKREDAVVIENAPFGIRSAKKAGLRCLAITTSLPKRYLKNADWIFSSIRNLEEKAEFIRK